MKIVKNYERTGYEKIGGVYNGLKTENEKYNFFEIKTGSGKASYMVSHDDFCKIFDEQGNRVMNQFEIEKLAIVKFDGGLSEETAKQLLKKSGINA